MLDLVVRGGELVDGTGAAPRRADIGISDGLVVAIDADLSQAESRDVIDAAGCIVTPGFVDVHTHYDGQVTWDEKLEPSTPHGVTTVMMGNCGVGFAPVRPGSESRLIELMEGVEDIPGTALHEGISWGWESFPAYMDVLRTRRWSADVGVQMPHGPLRSYVMGDRGATGAQASTDELDEMCRLVEDAMRAGAFGFTTSRTMGHRSLDGTPVPGTFADDDELFAIARAVKRGGGRIFEVAASGIVAVDDAAVVERELDWIGQLALETGLTASFLVLQQDHEPLRWRDEMDRARAWREKGARVVPLVAGRPFGMLFGWDLRHPFRFRPSYEAIASLPLEERMEHLRRPEVRERILTEQPVAAAQNELMMQAGISQMLLPRCFVLDRDSSPDYEPPASSCLAALAESQGTSVEAVAYDAMARGAMLVVLLFNYSEANHDALYEQMQDEAAVLGLADGGAHCGAICDASIPTYVLTHWVRDRTRGPRLELPDAVRRLTAQPADLYGLADRGRIQTGLRADLNVIDFDHLYLHSPRAAQDLPAGGTRVLQDATGYVATIVGGEITRRDGSDTGARPGRLVVNRA